MNNSVIDPPSAQPSDNIGLDILEQEELELKTTELKAVNEKLEAKTAELKAADESLAELNLELAHLNQVLTQTNVRLAKVNKKLATKNKELVLVNIQIKHQNEAQQEFINIAAHELRTPIMPILGIAEMLDVEYQEQNKQEILVDKRHNETIFRNARRLERLAENILDVSKIKDNKLKLYIEEFVLNDIIMNAIDDALISTADNKRVTVCNKTKILYNPREPIYIKADKDRISQVIYNLLNNAFKFTEGGTIIIDVQNNIDSVVEDSVVVLVKDTGIGIAPEIQPKLYSKFVTDSCQGMGLGLYISKNIIEKHGGRIWAENNANGEKGATFGFSLPLTI
ncbi:MAG: ATP-binding protein [Nitrososphaeraceae archaeon]